MKDQNKKDDKDNKVQYLPIFLCLGAGIGFLLGITVFDSISLGLPIGVSLGVLIGAVMDNNKNKK